MLQTHTQVRRRSVALSNDDALQNRTQTPGQWAQANDGLMASAALSSLGTRDRRSRSVPLSDEDALAQPSWGSDFATAPQFSDGPSRSGAPDLAPAAETAGVADDTLTPSRFNASPTARSAFAGAPPRGARRSPVSGLAGASLGPRPAARSAFAGASSRRMPTQHVPPQLRPSACAPASSAAAALAAVNASLAATASQASPTLIPIPAFVPPQIRIRERSDFAPAPAQQPARSINVSMSVSTSNAPGQPPVVVPPQPPAPAHVDPPRPPSAPVSEVASADAARNYLQLMLGMTFCLLAFWGIATGEISALVAFALAAIGASLIASA